VFTSIPDPTNQEDGAAAVVAALAAVLPVVVPLAGAVDPELPVVVV